MRKNDYFDIYTIASLDASAELLPTVFELFGEQADINELETPKSVSVGGLGHDGQRLNYTSWIDGLRKEGVRQTGWRFLPGHGVGCVTVTTADRTAIFTGVRIVPSRYAMTGAAFGELIDAQDQPEPLWEKVVKKVSEFNKINSRPVVDRAGIKAYLSTDSFKTDGDFIFDDLLSEVQVACSELDLPFRIPTSHQHLLTQYKSAFGSQPAAYNENAVYFYLLDQLTAEQLLELAGAQTFPAAEIWEKMPALTEYYSEFEGITAEAWPEYVASPEAAEQLITIGQLLPQAIVQACEAHGVQPVVPEDMKELTGPKPEELPRIRAKARIENDRWRLDDNKDYWELYFYEELDPAVISAETPAPLKEAAADFYQQLEKIRAFAARIESPFEEAFAVGMAFLEQGLPEGDAGEEHWQEVRQILAQRRTSERAQSNAKSAFGYAFELLQIGWSWQNFWYFCAYDMTDVFGGMGSWNDSYFPEQADYEELQTLNDSFARTRTRLWEVLMSDPGAINAPA
jgi:hypothetical protein